MKSPHPCSHASPPSVGSFRLPSLLLLPHPSSLSPPPPHHPCKSGHRSTHLMKVVAARTHGKTSASLNVSFFSSFHCMDIYVKFYQPVPVNREIFVDLLIVQCFITSVSVCEEATSIIWYLWWGETSLLRLWGTWQILSPPEKPPVHCPWRDWDCYLPPEGRVSNLSAEECQNQEPENRRKYISI